MSIASRSPPVPHRLRSPPGVPRGSPPDGAGRCTGGLQPLFPFLSRDLKRRRHRRALCSNGDNKTEQSIFQQLATAGTSQVLANPAPQD